MRKIYFLLISFMLLTGCAQNLALLGPAVSIATTGGVQQIITKLSQSNLNIEGQLEKYLLELTLEQQDLLLEKFLFQL